MTIAFTCGDKMSWSADSLPEAIGPSIPPMPAPSKSWEESSKKRRIAESARKHLPEQTSEESLPTRVKGRWKRLEEGEAKVKPVAKRAKAFYEHEEGATIGEETEPNVSLNVWNFSDKKGEVKVVLTPGSAAGKRTMALALPGSYHKFRNITSLPEEAAKDPPFHPEEWIHLGEEYLSKADLEAAIAAISGPLRRTVQAAVDQYLLAPGRLLGTEVFLSERVARAVSSASSPHGAKRAAEDQRCEKVCSGVLEQVRTGKLKLSAVRGWKRRHTIVPILKRPLGHGTSKQVGLAFPLEGGSLPERVMAVAKLVTEAEETSAAKAEKVASLRKEVWLSEIFRHQGIPHVLCVREITRGDGEIGAMMPFCKLGDLFDVTRRIAREPIQDADRRQLLLHLAIHVGETAGALHSHGYVHCDLKSANVFVNGSSDVDPEAEAFLADYDCTSVFGTESSVAGTFPPPEAVRELDAGKKVQLAPSIDAWAYGVLLYELFSGRKDVVSNLSFDNGVRGIMEGRAKALAALPEHDPIADVIRGLLSLSPGRRLTVEDAVQRLQRQAV